METFSNSSSENNPIKIISLVSWILVLITGWLFFGVPNFDKVFIFWNNIILNENQNLNPFPLIMFNIFFYIIAIIILLLLTFSFFVYAYNVFKKNENVLNGMLGNQTKFHFIPLLCISALFINGECTEEEDHILLFTKTQLYFFIIFTILALISLIYIYINTKLDSEKNIQYLIKNGTYACLISFLIYNFFVAVWALIITIKYKDLDFESIYKPNKNLSIVFSIFIGLINLVLSFFLNEISISIINFLIYIGLTIKFFKIEKDIREAYLNNSIGIIEIIMIILSLLMMGLVFSRKKNSNN